MCVFNPFLFLPYICFNACLLVLFSGVYFHAEGVMFACLYYWSRREPYTPVSVSFMTVQGYQLPFLLLLLHLLMGRDLWLDAFGLAAGHVYYFLREVLPANGNMICPSFCSVLLCLVPLLFSSASSELLLRCSSSMHAPGTAIQHL